jgi:hypothetical protein
VADAHHAVRLAFAPGFAAQAGSFTPHRTHHHRSASLEHAEHAFVGPMGDFPSLDMADSSTKTARARAVRSARTRLPAGLRRHGGCDPATYRHAAHTGDELNT